MCGSTHLITTLSPLLPPHTYIHHTRTHTHAHTTHTQAISSGFLLYAVPFKSLNPACHDSGIWSEALRMSSHLAHHTSFPDTSGAGGTGVGGDPYTPAMLLELYRLARNQGNLKLSHNLIQRQILELTGETEGAVEALSSSLDIPGLEKLRVMRELAKLHACRGQTASAIDLLTSSVVSYCQGQREVGGPSTISAATATIGPLGSGAELAARSLLVIVKWMQSDTRLMQAVWSSEYDISQRMSLLLRAEYDCRRARLGLYEGAGSQESYELFQPDDSVARFDKHEYSIGQLLHLSTMYCPDLAKAWWALAGWCYRIGRKNLEALRWG